VLAVVGVWLLTFFATWASTEPSPMECNDTLTSVAAACAAQSQSLLPALPVATGAAVAVAVVVPPRRLPSR